LVTVHHYYPLGSSNVGDALVAHAIRNALRRHFGALQFVHFPVNDRCKNADQPFGLIDANLKRTNAEADLVVVGGSNLLEPRKPLHDGDPRANWHWGVATDVDALQRLRPPLLLLGMGTGSDWGRSIRSYSPRAAGEVRLLHETAFASAVRDQPTVNELTRIGVHTECTGCPVTFLTDRPIAAQSPTAPLLVSLPPARILKTWSGQWFMRQTMRYLSWLVRQGVSVVATLHERADLEYAPHWVPQGIPRFYTERVDELIGRYGDSCGVIGFRLHAALLAIGLGKPIVPVSIDWRGRAFVQTFNLQHMALEPSAWGQFRKLRTWTQKLLSNDPALLNWLYQQKERWQRTYHHFLADAAGRFEQLRRDRAPLVRAA
jgi:hypothetical protein